MVFQPGVPEGVTRPERATPRWAMLMKAARSASTSAQNSKRIRAQIRSWRLHLRSGWTLRELAREINAVVRGWIGYYGRYYPSALVRSLNRINDYLVRWIVQNTSGTGASGSGPGRRCARPEGCTPPLRPLETRQAVTADDQMTGAV
jgi:Group II intron, maturase-specific domain